MPKNPNAPATGATTRKTTARHVSLRSAIDADAVPREPTGRLALQFRGWRRNETRRPRARRPQKKSPGRGAGAFGVGDRRSEAEAQGPDDLVRVEIAGARREAGYDAAFRLAAMEIAVADVERERRAEIERAARHGLPGELVLGAAGDAVHGAAGDVDGRAVDLVLGDAGAGADVRDQRPNEGEVEIDIAVQHRRPVAELRPAEIIVLEIAAIVEGDVAAEEGEEAVAQPRSGDIGIVEAGACSHAVSAAQLDRKSTR